MVGLSYLRKNPVVSLIWAALGIEIVVALFAARWSLAFVAAMTLGATMLPFVFQRSFGIKLPVGFLTAIVLFLYGSLFLGEAEGFYGRFWWWDIALHGGSAIGFGMIGFVVVFMLFEGDRYAAPAIAVAFFGFCFAVMVGALWEVFEFAMDQTFGLNMQKSGLVDTMWDMIANFIGALLGASAGFLYLKGRSFGGLGSSIRRFVRENRRFFRKNRE